MRKKIYNLIIFFLTILLFFNCAHFASAAPDLWGGQYETIEDQLGLGTGDPRVLAANIIRIALGFLGIIAIGLIIYAGWLWMTAKGEADKIEKAKKVLISAAIGLLIILSAFAIASFILNKLIDAAGGEDSGACYPPCVGQCCIDGVCQECSGGGLATSFYVKSTQPVDRAADFIRNTKIKFTFNTGVNAATAILGDTFMVISEGAPVSGVLTVEGNRVIFTPQEVCPENPCGAEHCLPANKNIIVRAVNEASGIISAGGLELSCGGIFNPCEIAFNTGDKIDCENPRVDFNSVQVCAETVNPINSWASDDSGIDNIEFFAAENSLGQNINFAAANPFNTVFNWDSVGLAAGIPINLKAVAIDYADNLAEKNRITVLRPAHCCNYVKDDDEIGVDCGGSCAACAGAACGASESVACAGEVDCAANNDRCSSGFCDCGGSADNCAAAGYDVGIENCCLCQDKPVIYWVSPQGGFCRDAVGNPTNIICASDAVCGEGICDNDTPNGAPGNLVSIGGRNFGQTAGKVFFTAADGGEAQAQLASTINANCNNSWQDDQIIAVVPVGAANGPIKVVDDNSYEDYTNNGSGPVIKDLIINSIERPGLCKVNPNHEKMGRTINYHGIALAGSIVEFGEYNNYITAVNSAFPIALQGSADVPNLQIGKTTTFALIDEASSNYLYFIKDKEPDTGPRIENFEPTSGNIGQYVTIYGRDFSPTRGASKVYFGEKEASYDFPEICADSVWNNNQVIIKVPDGIAAGNYIIKMEIGAVIIDTSALAKPDFQVDLGLPLAPSLCRISPLAGLPNSEIAFWGEYFGPQATGLARFHFNKDQAGPAILFWGRENGVDKCQTTVPEQAESGPARIIQNGLAGNGINFKVGNCAKDEDCGGGSVCCPADSPEQGRCKPEGADKYANCYITVKSSVFEWSFSTAAKLACDSNPLTPQCDADDLICQKLGFDFCDFNNGCVCANKPDLESCVGYSNGKCGENLCPNSSGQCSFYAGGNPKVIGTCDQTCNSASGCAGDLCQYDVNLNKCVLKDVVCDLNRSVNDALGKAAIAYCADYNGEKRWLFDSKLSCPAGWTNIEGDKCAENNTNCNLCLSDFKCQDDYDGGQQGVCAVDKDICPEGSLCEDNECKKTDQAACECCCRIDNFNQDCCSPLKCEGNCGSDIAEDTNIFGYCSGCANAGATEAEHDASCNCSGHSGKFCDISPEHPEGICSDCSRLATPEQCLAHSNTCCVDAKNGFKCGNGDGTLVLGGYCAYYSCNAVEPYNCLGPESTGIYKGDAACGGQCKASDVSGGDTCFNTETGFCDLVCGAGYGCLGETCGGAACSDGTCACCCNPADDKCGDINEKLSCTADKEPCSGESRGLCCGCSVDSDCGDPDNVGCGADSCCQSRPAVESEYPADESAGACRNTLITALFSEKMDLKSFSGNVVVAGDYGSEQCPEGTQFLAEADYSVKTGLAEIFYKLKNFIKKNLKKIAHFGRLAKAFSEIKDDHNYCAIAGAVSGYTNAAGKGAMLFKAKKLLDANRKYYVIIKGDDNLSDADAKGVLNKSGIGMKGEVASAAFNAAEYANAHIRSFDTGDEICELSYVTIDPASYLMRQANESKEFQAYPKSSNGQTIAPIDGLYNWQWSWSSENTSVAAVTDSDSDIQTVTAKNVKDGKTTIKATATIAIDNARNPSDLGKTKTGKAEIYVLLCENPWPPVSDLGIWEPWQDSDLNCTISDGGCADTGFELYYCRDSGQAGTADDLPAILSGTEKSVIRGKSEEKNILKEVYFFGEESPGYISNFEAVDALTGGKVNVSWPESNDSNVIGYKIYYSKKKGDYENYADLKISESPNMCAAEECSYVISDLENKIVYYFAQTSYYKTGGESEYSNEAEAAPTDKTAPAVPENFSAAAGNGKIELSWDENFDDTTGYKIYYGTSRGVYGESETINKNNAAIISDLVNGVEYFFAISALDSYNNESGKSEEVSAVPAEIAL